MTDIKLEIGLIYTYTFGIIPETPYKYIVAQKHGVALVEDKHGNRWTFSRTALIPATEEQIKDFNTPCPKCGTGEQHYH